MSRNKTIINTMYMNLFLQVINFSYKFVITPFLLNAWGGIKYGEWLILFSFVSSISLLNFGIAKYYGNNLRKTYIKNDIESYKFIFLESIFLVACIFVVLTIFIAISISLIDLTSLLNISHWSNYEVKWSILFLGMSIAGSIFLELISYFYVSIGQYSIKPLLSSINMFVQLILIIGFTYLKVGILAISAIILFTVITVTVVSLAVFIYKNKNLIPSKIQYSLISIVLGIKESSYFQLITLSQFFVIQGSVLIIGNKLGALSVSLFIIVRTISSGLGRQLIQIINHSIWPELTTLFAEKNYTKLRYLHNILSKVSIILLTMFMLFLLLFINDIMYLWLSTYEYLDYTLIGLFLVYLLTLYTWIPSSFILMSNNNINVLGKYSFYSALVFLSSAIYFLPQIGLHGIVVLMIIVDILFMSFVVSRDACSSIQENFLQFLYRLVKLLIPAAIILISFFTYFIKYIVSYPFVTKLVFFVISILLLLMYHLLFTISVKERQYIINKLKRIKK